MLAMVLYPEVQRKAQSELDSVIGMDRLPTFEDRESLPYVNALCKELLRCYPVFPLGVPHWVTEDDVYGDYFIPGGSIVIGNAWCVHSRAREECKHSDFIWFLGPCFMMRRCMAPNRRNSDLSVFSNQELTTPPLHLDLGDGAMYRNAWPQNIILTYRTQ